RGAILAVGGHDPSAFLVAAGGCRSRLFTVPAMLLPRAARGAVAGLDRGPDRQLGEEARGFAGVAGRAHLLDPDQQRPAGAVQRHRPHVPAGAGGPTLPPVAAAAAGPVGGPAGGQRPVQRLVVHPGEHQDLAGAVFLHHRGDQAVGVAAQPGGDRRVEHAAARAPHRRVSSASVAAVYLRLVQLAHCLMMARHTGTSGRVCGWRAGGRLTQSSERRSRMYPYPPHQNQDEPTMADVRGVLPSQRPPVDITVLDEPTSEVPVIKPTGAAQGGETPRAETATPEAQSPEAQSPEAQSAETPAAETETAETQAAETQAAGPADQRDEDGQGDQAAGAAASAESATPDQPPADQPSEPQAGEQHGAAPPAGGRPA